MAGNRHFLGADFITKIGGVSSKKFHKDVFLLARNKAGTAPILAGFEPRVKGKNKNISRKNDLT